ncbi:hypothetical protein AAFF_G00251850 [Aldrovandia affinis]|uniref:Uncharacterized protein n=1 Tax=Aldrovandia affinis TaxID=143900 RepID=A0AAD7STX3_9TELE|nr:hypothetical protein AAFF_G00251850 [Aldrovandia affinis]
MNVNHREVGQGPADIFHSLVCPHFSEEGQAGRSSLGSLPLTLAVDRRGEPEGLVLPRRRENGGKATGPVQKVPSHVNGGGQQLWTIRDITFDGPHSRNPPSVKPAVPPQAQLV